MRGTKNTKTRMAKTAAKKEAYLPPVLKNITLQTDENIQTVNWWTLQGLRVPVMFATEERFHMYELTQDGKKVGAIAYALDKENMTAHKFSFVLNQPHTKDKDYIKVLDELTLPTYKNYKVI